MPMFQYDEPRHRPLREAHATREELKPLRLKVVGDVVPARLDAVARGQLRVVTLRQVQNVGDALGRDLGHALVVVDQAADRDLPR